MRTIFYVMITLLLITNVKPAADYYQVSSYSESACETLINDMHFNIGADDCLTACPTSIVNTCVTSLYGETYIKCNCVEMLSDPSDVGTDIVLGGADYSDATC